MRLLLVVPFLLAGCASIPQPNEFSAQIERRALDLQARQLATPTITISCVSGCEAKYFDPSKVRIQRATNQYDAAIARDKAIGLVINRALPLAAGAYVASEVIDGLAAGRQFINHGTISGRDTIGGDSGSGNIIGSDLSTGHRLNNVANDYSDNRDLSDNSDNSDNSDRSDNSDNSYNPDNSTDVLPEVAL